MHWWERPWAAIALLGALVVVAYAGSVENGFCFDDRGIVADNSLVRQGRWSEIFRTDYWGGATGDRTGLYRPLTVASFALNHALFPDQAWAYHLFNLLLHLAAAIGVLLLGRSWLGPAGGWLAGLFFGLHPALSEAVDSLVGRAELLSCGLGLIGVWAWSRAAGRGGYALGFAALVAAPLAKENGICFALALAVWGFFHHRRQWARWAGALAAALCSLGVKWLVLGRVQPEGIGFIDNPLAYVTAPVRALNSAGLLARYLKLLVFPWPLAADYSYDQIPVIHEPGSGAIWAPLALLGGLGLLGGWWLRRPPATLWGGVSGGAALLVSNLFLPGGTIFAERLLYLPAVGFCLGWGWAVSRLAPKGLLLVAGGWCLAAIPLVWARTVDWRDDLSLFTRTVAASPHSARSHYGLALALHERGKPEAAMEAYDRALRIFPRYAEAHFNRGAALLALGRQPEALEAYRRAAACRPGYAKALYAVAVLVQHLEGERAAIPAYQALLAAAPGHAEGAKGLGRLLLQQGDPLRAEQVLQAALAANPGEAELVRLLEQAQAAPRIR